MKDEITNDKIIQEKLAEQEIQRQQMIDGIRNVSLDSINKVMKAILTDDNYLFEFYCNLVFFIVRNYPDEWINRWFCRSDTVYPSDNEQFARMAIHMTHIDFPHTLFGKKLNYLK